MMGIFVLNRQGQRRNDDKPVYLRKHLHYIKKKGIWDIGISARQSVTTRHECTSRALRQFRKPEEISTTGYERETPDGSKYYPGTKLLV
jgi:hypothetical protein